MTAQTAVDAAIHTDPIVLVIMLAMIGSLGGMLTVTIGRLTGAIRQSRLAGTRWQPQSFIISPGSTTSVDPRFDTGSDVTLLCSLVSDITKRKIISKDNALTDVGARPVPYIALEAADGRLYVLTSDVTALCQNGLITGQPRVWHIRNHRSVTFVRAQALWERVRNVCPQSGTRPLTVWHIAALNPAAWHPYGDLSTKA